MNQTKHDSKVLSVALELTDKGYSVWADLPEYARPPELNGAIPDVYAEGHGLKLAYEIEHKDSIATTVSTNQIIKLQNWANGVQNRIFEIIQI